MILNYGYTINGGNSTFINVYQMRLESSCILFLYKKGTPDYDNVNHPYRQYAVGILVKGVCQQLSRQKHDAQCTLYYRDQILISTGNSYSTVTKTGTDANHYLYMAEADNAVKVYSENDYTCDGYVFDSLASAQAFIDTGDTSGIIRRPPVKVYTEMPEEVKALYLSDSIRKNIRIHFPNGERADIINDNIDGENFSFTERLCSRSQFKLGLCESNVVKFTCVDVENIKGYTIEVFHEIDISSFSTEMIMECATRTDDVAYPYFRWSYGIFVVDSCPRQSDMTKRKVVAYSQRLHDNSDTNPVERLKQSVEVPNKVPYKFDVMAYIASNIKRFYKAQNGVFFEDGSDITDVVEETTRILQYEQGTLETTRQLNCTYARLAYYGSDFTEGDVDIFLVNFECNKVSNYKDIVAEIMSTTGYTDATAFYPLCNISTGSSEQSVTYDTDYMFYPYITGMDSDGYIEIVLPLKVTNASIDLRGNVTVRNEWTLCGSYKATRFCLDSDYFTHILSFDRAKTSNGGYCCNANSIKFGTIASACLELNGLFGRASRKGGVEFFKMSEHFGTYPSAELFPGSDTYLGIATGGRIDRAYYSPPLWYDETYTLPYGKVIAEYEKESSQKAQYVAQRATSADSDEEDGEYQVYSLADNYLIKNGTFTEEQIKKICALVESNLENVTYMPATIKAVGMPWLETGDVITVDVGEGVIETVILRRTLKGVQSLRDNFESR